MPRDAVSRTANVERTGRHKWVNNLSSILAAISLSKPLGTISSALAMIEARVYQGITSFNRYNLAIYNLRWDPLWEQGSDSHQNQPKTSYL